MTPSTPSAEAVVITGATRLVAIIGDPIAQVRSPSIYNPKLARAGSDAVLVPMRVPPEAFDETMRGLMRIGNLAGLVVTLPFKERAVAFADRVGEIGSAVGAINALRREDDGSWTGDMFDGIGLVRALGTLGKTPKGLAVMLVGAGGAGSAIAFSLAREGVASLTIFDVDASRAQRLVKRLARSAPNCQATYGAPDVLGKDLLVNATPVGMTPGDGLPFAVETLPASVTVIDIVPKPAVTPLLALAAQCGCPHRGGATMVDGQSDAVIEFLRL
jgi:shikimate dehydrogenase